ncbi:diaminopimelate epimerase [Zafaria sp. Z1313]|uniref:diaminopimelate epimerase n=1 Tax=unclassified Zafaria TaxID=2828765 RepID=UPI002E76340E|nr:diaminopimelate epimerase [Zafaria sp. J156]MEE1621974.1 diaminopimelate epimerase [Zafaria sp. J156]
MSPAQLNDPLDALSGLAVAKGHGTGNDFVLVADPDGTRHLAPEDVAALCDRHHGLGGDGLIRAVPSRFLPEGEALLRGTPGAEWFMDYRNADGSVSEMCGNGVRVFVHFLLEEGLARLEEGAALPIGTRAGVKTVTRAGDGYAVDMGPWEFAFPAQAEERALDSMVETDGLDVDRPALSVSMGNPHTVVALSEESELEQAVLFTAPRVDPVPPHGTNVEYVVPADPLVVDGVGRIRMRVHERGVGETRSCGTGACAAVVATRHWAGGALAARWDVEVPGGTVSVRFVPGADGREHVELSGPARLVARAVLA